MGAAYAMADHHSPDWVPPALGTLGLAITGLLTFLGVRVSARAPKTDPQAVQNDGWEALLDQMRIELKAASRERNHLNQVLEEERRAWRTEREAWRVEREAFLGRINQLQAVAEGFERLLRRSGAAIPERRTYPAPDPTHGEAQIVGATLRQDAEGED